MAKHPAAFINAIAEEGTKAEAIEFLQKTWDELCDARAILAEFVAAIDKKWEHESPRKRANGVSPRMDDALERARAAIRSRGQE